MAKKLVAFRVPAEIAEALRVRAGLEERTMSAVAARMLADGLGLSMPLKSSVRPSKKTSVPQRRRAPALEPLIEDRGGSPPSP